MKYAILIILGIVLSLVATAGVSAGVKPLMDQMLNQIFILKPFLVSEEKFADQKNSKTIQRALQNMADISVKIAHEDSIKKSGFQMPAKVLTAQLRESELIFSAGNKNYSLWMVKSTLGVCISCHTQLPAVSTRFTTLNNLKVLRNPFEEAEFLFTIRNFDEAMPLYQNALKGYPQNAVTVDSLEKIVYRQLYYYVRVARDFKALVKTLDANLTNSNLSASQRQKIQSLKVAAGEFDGAQYPRFKTTEGAQLRSFVETNLKAELSGDFKFGDSRRELNYLRVSGVLYDFLNDHPETPLKPDILYWLSFCETQNRYQNFYSLPEMYLKQCVTEYPQNPIAAKCLNEYQDLITFAYSGSSGTHIPAEVTKELKSLQELVRKVPAR